MTKKKPKESDSGIRYSMGGTSDNRVWEVIYDGEQFKFALGTRMPNGEVEVSTVWEVDGEWLPNANDGEGVQIMYRPLESDLIKKGTVIVASGIQKYQSKTQLYDDTFKFLTKYVDLPEVENRINVHYVAMSWLYDRLSELPYRRFLGDYGTGKSRALTAMAKLAYRSIIFKASATPATIFRMIEQVRGTLCIDEMNLSDGVYSETFTALESILCAGYEKNSSVVRCIPTDKEEARGEKGYALEAFQTFSPKILSSREQFKDRALESRCLTATTYRTKNPNIPFSLGEDFEAEAESLRNQWLVFRLVNYWKPLNEPKKIAELKDVEPRIKQIIAPLARVAYRMGGTIFEDYAKGQQEDAIINRQETDEGRLLNALLEINGLEQRDVSTAQITGYLAQDDKQWTPRRTARVIRQLGFKKIRGKYRIGGDGKAEARPHLIVLSGRYHQRYMQLLEQYYLIDNGEPTQQAKLDRIDHIDQSVQVIPPLKEGIKCPFCPDTVANQNLLDLHLRLKHGYQGDDE